VLACCMGLAGCSPCAGRPRRVLGAGHTPQHLTDAIRRGWCEESRAFPCEEAPRHVATSSQPACRGVLRGHRTGGPRHLQETGGLRGGHSPPYPPRVRPNCLHHQRRDGQQHSPCATSRCCSCPQPTGSGRSAGGRSGRVRHGAAPPEATACSGSTSRMAEGRTLLGPATTGCAACPEPSSALPSVLAAWLPCRGRPALAAGPPVPRARRALPLLGCAGQSSRCTPRPGTLLQESEAARAAVPPARCAGSPWHCRRPLPADQLPGRDLVCLSSFRAGI